MWRFVQEHLKDIWKGFIGGCFAGGTFLFAKQDILAKGLVSLLVVFISGCLGAMGTALGNDIYKGKFNKRVKTLFGKCKSLITKKQKKNDEREKAA